VLDGRGILSRGGAGEGRGGCRSRRCADERRGGCRSRGCGGERRAETRDFGDRVEGDGGGFCRRSACRGVGRCWGGPFHGEGDGDVLDEVGDAGAGGSAGGEGARADEDGGDGDEPGDTAHALSATAGGGIEDALAHGARVERGAVVFGAVSGDGGDEGREDVVHRTSPASSRKARRRWRAWKRRVRTVASGIARMSPASFAEYPSISLRTKVVR